MAGYSGSGCRRDETMKTALALAMTAIGLAGVAFAQQNPPPLGKRLKMRWHGEKVIFREGGRIHEVSIKDQFQAVRVETVILQSAKESSGFIYLLLDVTG